MPLLAAKAAVTAEGTLSDNQRITSEHLGYDLQYRVYLPPGVTAEDKLPTLYVTDGQAYIEEGRLKSVLDSAIDAGLVQPLLVIFLDSRNPDNLRENRRNELFMCNSDFAAFFADELIPAISTTQPASLLREDRVVLGLSFGGLNSACFGLLLPNLFEGIAMQSPASDRHLAVVSELYEESPALPLKMFLSVGTKNDNGGAVRRFKRILEDKGYDLHYQTVREGHNWDNWRPLLIDVLTRFFAEDSQTD